MGGEGTSTHGGSGTCNSWPGRMRGNLVASSADETADSSTAPNVGGSATTCMQGIFDLLVPRLHHPVALRVAGIGEHVIDAKPHAGTSPYCMGELGAPVCYDRGWHAKTCHPIGNESICARAGLHVAQLQLPSTWLACQWRSTSTHGLPYDVHMGESACRYRNGMEWSCWLLVDLSPLALLAVSALGCHVFAHTLPDKTCRHHTFGGTYARVGHAVDGVGD